MVKTSGVAEKTVGISEGCLALKMSYGQVRHLLFTGRLEGGRDEAGRLYVTRASLDALLRVRHGEQAVA